MKAILFTGPEQIEYTEVPTPTPGPEDILVKVAAVGICASDEELLSGEHPYIKNGNTVYPVLPGHEWSGHIASFGSEVPEGLFAQGDAVTADVTMSCGKCSMCKEGRYNLCTNRGVIGSYKNRAGAYAEYITVPWKHVYRLPEGMSLDTGALSEPSATALYTVKRVGIDPGATVAVFGDGPIGLLITSFARALGAGKIIQIGSWNEKLDISRSLGADEIINYHDEDVVKKIGEATEGKGADIIFESSGNDLAFSQSAEALAPGGKLGLVSFYRKTQFEAPINALITKDASIYGTLASPNTTAPVLKLINSGSVHPEYIITHHFPLEDAEKAFALIRERKECRVKILLHP